MALKENLKKFMDEKKMTIRELAKFTDISEPTLKRLRSSTEANPTLDILIRISKVLNVTVNQLIEDFEELVTFHQNEKIILNGLTTNFIYIFTKNTFSFSKGTKAIFKKYKYGDPVTKYIFTTDGELLERIDLKKGIYRNEMSILFSINTDSILAFIIKELYEVNYV